MNQREKVCYNTDTSRLIGKAERVLFPESIEEVKQIVKSSGFDIVPRGAGTGFSGGTIPNNSIVIDMSKMIAVTNFNSQKRSVRVEAGITVRELNEKLKAVSCEFPIIPSNDGISSIGGMIATNATGNRSMKYGIMKEWVDEVEFINGKGEFVKTTKADLSEVCGMEGITGIIVAATIRTIPLIKRSASVFQTDSFDELLSVARRLRQEKEVCMLAFFSKDVSKLLGFPESYHVIIEFDSNRGKITGEEYEKLSKIKEKAFHVLFAEGYFNNEDPKLFFDGLKEFLPFLEENNIPYFGDFGSGIVHPFFKDSEKNKRAMVNELCRKLKTKIGKYGYGLLRKSFMDSFDARMIQRVKLRYDPHEKFNRGKVIDIDASLIKSDHSNVYHDKQQSENKIPERKIIDSPIEKKEIVEKINDYKQTFSSESSSDKVKQVEQFAKAVPQVEIQKESFNPKRAPVDFKTINSIMTNNKKTSNESDAAKLNPSNSIDKKSEVPISNNNSKSSESEQDIINRILGNRYKKEEKK